MVCTLPSTRSLSKASREGDWRENMANADISASGKAISVSSVRASGMLAKPFRTKRKSASAERCLRPLGATIDIAPPHVKAVHRVSVRGILSHGGLRKDNPDIKVITGFYRSPGIAGKGMPTLDRPQCLALTLSRPETFTVIDAECLQQFV